MPDLETEIAEAIQGEEAPPAQQPAPGQEPATPSTPEAGAAAGGESNGSPETAESPDGNAPAPASDVTAEDVPERYVGIDLSDLPAEKRAELFENARKADQYTQSLQQRLKEAEEKLASGETPSGGQGEIPGSEVPLDQITDEQVAIMYGLSADDPFYDVKSEVLIPVARRQIQQDQVLQDLQYKNLVQETSDRWHSELDSLEAAHGELPVPRETLFQFAIDHDILEPVDAYNRMMMGYKEVVERGATEIRQKEAAELRSRKLGASTLRPGGSVPVDEGEPQGKNLDEIIKAAAKMAEAEVGTSWESAAAAGT